MTRDESVLVIGEGVPDPKAIFGTTAGLREKYGVRRVFDMPLSENGATGFCIGAALTGMRPVMVHQRIDFALLAMDQLVNNAAKWHYMFDGKSSVPLTVRMIIGRGWGQGPQHSQSLQAMLAQVPGLRVIMPASAYDAKGMLTAAIEDDNPVLIIEHRWLHALHGAVPRDYYTAPLEGAVTRIDGSAVTIAAFSLMVVEAIIAAKALRRTCGIEVEVLDMRSIRPLDVEGTARSLSKTGRLIVADTAHRSGSIASEMVARIVERHWASLRSAPVLVTAPDHPVPTSPSMAADYYPSARTIADAVLRTMGLDENVPGYSELCRLTARKGAHDTPSDDFVGPF